MSGYDAGDRQRDREVAELLGELRATVQALRDELNTATSAWAKELGKVIAKAEADAHRAEQSARAAHRRIDPLERADAVTAATDKWRARALALAGALAGLVVGALPSVLELL